VRFGCHGLGEPGLELFFPLRRDGVTLAIRPVAGLRFPGHHLPVTRESRERGVDLAESQRFVAPEIGVVVALQVVAVAGFSFEETEQCQGNTHGG